MNTAGFQELRAHMGYPDVPLPVVRDWNHQVPYYAPVEYVSDGVRSEVRNPASIDPLAEWQRALRLSTATVLRQDPGTGRPLNPAGRTGISGLGRLRHYGPSLTADGYVTLGDYILVIERSDTGQLAVPGGYRELLDENNENEEYEHGWDAAVREVFEETQVRAYGNRVWLLGSGVAALSLRNTDHAWIENKSYHIDITEEYDSPPPAHAKDDAETAGWQLLADVDVTRMSHMHSAHVAKLRFHLAL